MKLNTLTRNVACVAAFAAAGIASAQLAIDWYTIDGGGGTSTGGGLTLSGTIGQPDAGPAMTGGNLAVTGGFWAAIPPPCPQDINSDGTIDTQDLVLLLLRFGQQVPIGIGPDIAPDGQVNTTDLIQLLVRFGQRCG